MDQFLKAALDEARLGKSQGGIPIGSVLVHRGEIIGRGHNRRVQKNSAILHAENGRPRKRRQAAGEGLSGKHPLYNSLTLCYVQRCHRALRYSARHSR